eukprot:2739416-Pyramimonas_sp.AAC.1
MESCAFEDGWNTTAMVAVLRIVRRCGCFSKRVCRQLLGRAPAFCSGAVGRGRRSASMGLVWHRTCTGSLHRLKRVPARA